MKSRTIAIILGVGALAALLGRVLVRPPTAAAPAPASQPSGPTATVAVYDDGAPASGRWVVFHDAAGTVTSATQTGKDGTAAGAVRSGGMVTVALGTSIKHLVTIIGVEPNERLVVGEAEDEGGPETTVCNAMVSLPGKHPKATRHALSLGVGTTVFGDTTKPLSMPVLKRYLVDGKFAALAEAVDTSGESVAFTHAWFDGCGKDAGAVDAHLPAWSTAFRSFELNVNGGEGASGDAGTQAITGELSIVGAGGDRFERGRREAPFAGRASLKFSAPEPLGTRAVYKLVVAHPGSPDRSVLEERRKALPEKLEIDLNARILPRVSEALVDSGAPRPTIRWRVAGPSDKADATVVRLSWPATGEHVWTVLTRPDAPARIALPALPDQLAAWRPDGRPITPAVALVDASFVDGFTDVKRKGLAVLEDPPDADMTFVRYSVTGTLDF